MKKLPVRNGYITRLADIERVLENHAKRFDEIEECLFEVGGLLRKVRCRRATEKALLCVAEDFEEWIPRSQIHENSEVWDEGHDGDLVIKGWFAEKNGWELD